MFVRRLVRLMGREIRQLTGNARLLAVILLVPIGYTLLLGAIYVPKRVTSLPAWVIDEDRSQLSRSIADALARNETFRVVRREGSLAEFKEATLHDRAYACIWIPRDFARDIKRGHAVRLLAVIDGSNMLIANSVTRAVSEVGVTYSVGVQAKRLAMRGAPSGSAISAAMPIETSTRVWYNPAFNYMDFLLPGLIGAVIQQVTLLGVALAFAREREHHLLADILSITTSPLEALAAKGLVYTALNLAPAFGALWLTIRHFGVTFTGSAPLLAALLCVFVFSLVALGVLVSAVARDQLFATQALMLLAVPSFLLSGYTWPQAAMLPGILQVSNLLPLTHFVLPLRLIMQQGADLAVVRPHFIWLWTLAACCYALAYLLIRRAMAIVQRTDVSLCRQQA